MFAATKLFEHILVFSLNGLERAKPLVTRLQKHNQDIYIAYQIFKIREKGIFVDPLQIKKLVPVFETWDLKEIINCYPIFVLKNIKAYHAYQLPL